MEEIQRRVGEPFNFRRDQFERLGLRSTMREPMRVCCSRCGAEIDPWRLLNDDSPHNWWQCPKGCNQPH